jgi:hypothetical protein
LVQEAVWIRFPLDFATSWRRYVDVNIPYSRETSHFCVCLLQGKRGRKGSDPQGDYMIEISLPSWSLKNISGL